MAEVVKRPVVSDEPAVKKMKLALGGKLPDSGRRVIVFVLFDVLFEGAFARLHGKCLKSGEEFTAYVTALPCAIGREHVNQPQSNFISLGTSKQISRIHASIDFDSTAGCYTIEPKGMNSCYE